LSKASHQKLEPPETHFFAAAVGWLELGNPAEARMELNSISTSKRNHPDVLEVEWAICAAEKNWEAALIVARRILEIAPQRPSGWLHQAYALRRVAEGGLQAAWEALLPGAGKFPKEATIPFNLACYACQMNRMDEARQWFQRALEIGGKQEILAMALSDSDLQPLWDEFRKM